jgi:hypothetical protein
MKKQVKANIFQLIEFFNFLFIKCFFFEIFTYYCSFLIYDILYSLMLIIVLRMCMCFMIEMSHMISCYQTGKYDGAVKPFC